jgi:hypothetical protein
MMSDPRNLFPSDGTNSIRDNGVPTLPSAGDTGTAPSEGTRSGYEDAVQLEAFASSVHRTARRLARALADGDPNGPPVRISLHALEYTIDRLITHARDATAAPTAPSDPQTGQLHPTPLNSPPPFPTSIASDQRAGECER